VKGPGVIKNSDFTYIKVIFVGVKKNCDFFGYFWTFSQKMDKNVRKTPNFADKFNSIPYI